MKILYTFLFAIASITVMAQDFTVEFNHVALSVDDVDRAANFYKNVLNLEEITNRTEQPGIRWFSLGGDKELHLISVVEGEIRLNKAVHFALMTSDFDAFVQSLEKNKVPYTNWAGTGKITVRADGIRQLYVQDPDGYWIEVNSVNK